VAGRVLHQDGAAFEESRHVFCAGERGDGVGVCVDEEDRDASFGLLEACVTRLVEVMGSVGRRREELPVKSWDLGGMIFIPAMTSGFVSV
jgi:hypothetical protein